MTARLVPLAELVTPASVARAGDADLPVLSMTSARGLVRQDEFFKKKIASRDVSQYKVVRPGQIVVGIHVDEGAIGVSHCGAYGIVSPAYTLWDINEYVDVDHRYLDRFIRSPRAHQYFVSNYRQTAERRGKLTPEKFLSLQVPLPPIEEQRRIAGVLDAADALRVKRRLALAKLDTLARSIFIATFGDPMSNPNRWPDGRTLADVADIRSGITIGRTTGDAALISVPYLTVVNVQDGAFVLEPLKTIGATASEIERLQLSAGDILLTEGGDPDKLGRGAVWDARIMPCIHQNHVFRVRVTGSRMRPLFLSHLLSSPRGKRYFLRMAKQTTGIASINMTQLRAFPILEPPLALQVEYERRLQVLDETRTKGAKSEAALEALFVSLQQRAFRGEL